MTRWSRPILLAVFLLHSISAMALGDPPRVAIKRHSPWRYHAAVDGPDDGWKQREFDDQQWKIGNAGFGYGDNDDNTVLTDMPGRFLSVYARATFRVPDPGPVKVLYLYVNYDDGFIAYLNGKQVASSFATRTGGTLRVGLHEAEGYEEFVINDAHRHLVKGDNVLAIEGHNQDLRSSDFSLDPFLLYEKMSGLEALLTKADLLQDLDQFQHRLEDQSSYLTRRGFDYKTALTRLRNSIDDETSVAEFTWRLRHLVMQLGDGHANVGTSFPKAFPGYLPCRLADTANGVAALSMFRHALLDEECPYVEAIDGLPLERWLDASAQQVAQGSPQLVRHRSVDWLGQIALWRHELNRPASPKVTLTLRSADSSERRKQTLRLTHEGFSAARVPLGKTRELDGNLGYLRIPQMDPRLIPSTVEQIKKFRDTEGLIIDVRDNGGGTYALLHAIYGFFVPADAKPYVTNIAAYRRSELFRPDHINYRPTFRASWRGWSRSELAAIEAARDRFQPEWNPPSGLFSDWHYMVLSRSRGNQDYFYYDKPVAVLCNAGSFSATDGFLSAFTDLPQVILVGEPSGGGSGATRAFQLRNTGATVAVASMASFRANGKLFDGNGVEVDVPVKPTVADFLGESDSVLEHAANRLRNTRRSFKN